MSTHNIGFRGEIRKISAFFRWKKRLICCYVSLQCSHSCWWSLSTCVVFCCCFFVIDWGYFYYITSLTSSIFLSTKFLLHRTLSSSISPNSNLPTSKNKITEPAHDKPTIRLVPPAKTQISMHICSVWSVIADHMWLPQPPRYTKRLKTRTLAIHGRC